MFIFSDRSLQNCIFRAYMKYRGKVKLKINDMLVFNGVTTNENNCYNSNRSVFVSPKDGVYFFAWKICMEDDFQSAVNLRVNGETQKISFNFSGPECPDDKECHCYLRLKQGDEVYLSFHAGSDSFKLNSTQFTGMFLF